MSWSAAAVAAQTTFARDLAALPLDAVAISMVLALIGGGAYTAQKIADPNVVIKSRKHEVVKDMLNSIVVGLLIFFGGVWQEWGSMPLAILITLGGYGGSRVLEPALLSFINWISRLWEKHQ